MKFIKPLPSLALVNKWDLQVSPGELLQVSPIIVPTMRIDKEIEKTFVSTLGVGTTQVIATTETRNFIVTGFTLSGVAATSAGTAAIGEGSGGTFSAKGELAKMFFPVATDSAQTISQDLIAPYIVRAGQGFQAFTSYGAGSLVYLTLRGYYKTN